MGWRRIESTSKSGSFYWYNDETEETSIAKPLEVARQERKKAKEEIQAREEKEKEQKEKEDRIGWKRIESSSKPGSFFYFHPTTGINQTEPPAIDPPWFVEQSTKIKGLWFYQNIQTQEQVWDPPPGCKPPDRKAKTAPVAKPVPPGWQVIQSSSH